jgi:endonuclease/exonuclease/phosphatase family metal-dependent hydrolase
MRQPGGIRIVTLNAGLLRRLAGLLEPAPYVAARRDALASALVAFDADVIALQEVYERHDQDVVIDAVGYPHVARGPGSTRLRLGSGLLVLSRRPFRSRFIAYDAAFVEELVFTIKGILVVELGDLTLVTTHTSAGGLTRHPEAADSDAVRDRQIQQLIRVGEMVHSPAIILGDLNTGPRVSETNYRRLVSTGWSDLFALHHPGDATSITWDPRNELNADGWHRRCPGQRIDHAFARASALERGDLTLRRCDIVLAQPSVPVGARIVTVSDHAGLLVELVRNLHHS